MKPSLNSSPPAPQFSRAGCVAALVFFLCASCLAIFAGWRHFEREADRIRLARHTELAAIGRMKAEGIHEWLEARLANARVMARGALVKRVADDFGRTRSIAASRRDLEEQFALVRDQYGFADVLLVDAEGRVLFSLMAPAGHTRLAPEERTALDAALDARGSALPRSDQPGRPYLFRCLDCAEIHLSVAAAAPGSSGLAVILRLDPANYLYPLIQSWPTPSRSAETLLIRRDGDQVLFLNDLRHRPNVALSLRLPREAITLPAAAAASGREGFFSGNDYRGVPVLADLRSVAGTPWFMVAKVDEEEILAEVRYRFQAVIFFVALAVLLAAGMTALLYHTHRLRLYRSLLDAERVNRETLDLFRITLYSIGDAVIATDTTGAVTHMNAVAENLTGWRETEARGLPLRQVFHIINEQTLAEVENPIYRVLRDGVVVGLANHTVLIARDGTRRPIADSGAPVRDENGKTLGTVMVFRDVTVEQRYSREREITLELLRMLNAGGDTRTLVRDLTGHLQRWTGCEAVGVRLREGDDFPYFETRGFAPEFVEAENYLCGRDADGRILRDAMGNPRLECMCGNVLEGRFDPSRPFFTKKGSFWSNNTTELLATTTEADRQAATRNRCNSDGYESVALIPLRAGERTFGLLQFNDRAPGRFTLKMIAFLEQLADQIAISFAQREAEDALRLQERTYGSLFENMINGFAHCRMIYDGETPTDFVYLDVNRAFETQTGLVDVVGRRVTEVIPGIREADPGLFEIYGRVARGGRPERFETEVTALGMWFEISVYSPQPDHFVAVFDVITERKRAEAALREKDALLNETSALAHIGGWEFDAETGAGAWTRECALIHEVDPDLKPTVEMGLSFFDGKARHAIDSAVTEAVRDGRAYDLELEMTTARGRRKWVRLIGAPVMEGDRVAKIRGSIQDITERKRLEEQFLQAQKMESVGRLAGGVAHDFNNLLTVMRTSLDFLELDRCPKPFHGEVWREISEATERATILTRQLLAFSRRQVVNPRPLDLNRLITELDRMLRRVIGEDVIMTFAPAAALPAIHADRGQMEQAIVNLAVNARDAMPNGGTLTLTTDVEEVAAGNAQVSPGRYVVLAVADTGVGMSPEIMDRIFDPFFTTKDVGKGSGLGLSTVFGIVTQSGGQVIAASEPGKGSAFRVYLPAHDGAAVVEEKNVGRGAAAGGGEMLLLAEDEASIRRVAARALEKMGYKVLVAADGEEALALATRHPGAIDLLLTDAVMPGMSGAELAHRVKKLHGGIKIVFMSGYTEEEILRKGVREGTIHFLEKPFSIANLTATIREALEGK